jgi:hypothetical protein
MTPPMCTAANASTRESMELFDMLLQNVGRIPNEIAGCAGSLYVLKYFLDHGLDPNARYQNGPTMMVGPLCFVLIPMVFDVGVIGTCASLLCALVIGEFCRRRAKMYVLPDYTET